jgi:hypothetical protein
MMRVSLNNNKTDVCRGLADEDTEAVISSRMLKKDRQCNGQENEQKKKQ